VTEQQLLRMAKRRLAILHHAEEITGDVALTCRSYGISRQCFYTWKRRWDAHGLEGLRDRSHRPQVSPNATGTEVVGKIIYLRQTYHFGSAKIAMYLKGYHDITISHSGVWPVLKRLDLNRLPASQRYKRHDRRWKRYEKPLPGHRVRLDVKFIQPLLASQAGSRGKPPARAHEQGYLGSRDDAGPCGFHVTGPRVGALRALPVDPGGSPALTGTCPGALLLSANAAGVEQP
jgi:transposase